MSLIDIFRRVKDALAGAPVDREPNVRPASEDPLGDPADAEDRAYGIRPASEDPLGDPADVEERVYYNVRPASEDPLGDPADTEDRAYGIRPASEDPLGDPADDIRDFANRFGSSDYTEQNAYDHLDRFQGHPAYFDAQREYLNQMSADEFNANAEQAAYQLPPEQGQNIANGLLGALQGRGFDFSQIAGFLGLSSDSPQQMQPQDLARLLGWAQQNQPDALHEALSDKPWFIKALGNSAVTGILSNLASRLFNQ
jgi:hypothetical protein